MVPASNPPMAGGDEVKFLRNVVITYRLDKGQVQLPCGSFSLTPYRELYCFIDLLTLAEGVYNLPLFSRLLESFVRILRHMH